MPRQSTFPEDIGTPADMPPIGKNRLSRVVSASALDVDAGFGASLATVNSEESKRVASGASIDAQRSPGLPALPESMSKIDIEQAINLLQQLKKTASPEELVSLHKALLPTRDVSPVPPPQLSSIEEHAAFSALSGRTRSSRPPGLATRGSNLEDPLRSQEEVAAKTAKGKESSTEHHGAWFQETMSAFHARTFSMTSTGTAPDSSYSRQGGAFGPGTLRITNGGAATPEPGEISKLAAESEESRTQVMPARRSEDAPVVVSAETMQSDVQRRQRRHSQDSASAAPSLSLGQRRSQQWGLRTSQAIPSLSSVVQPKPQGPRPEQSKQDPVQQKEISNDASSLRVSTDVPRFEQRWNHRASHLSNEYMLDCEINSSPYEEKVHELPASSNRLSTVKDLDEDADDSGLDACAKALLKLSGSPTSDTAQDGSVSGESPKESAPSTHAPHAATGESPPQVVRKQDSGYYSEASNSTSKRSSPNAASKATTLETTLEKPSVPAIDTSTATVPPVASAPVTPKKAENKTAADAKGSHVSLHSMLSATPDHDTPTASKKRRSPLSLFRSRDRDAKRSSVAANAASVASQPYDSLPTSPAKSTHTTKSSMDMRRRTLQKKIPEPVQKQRKEEQDKARQSMDMSQMTTGEPATDSTTTPMPEPPPTPGTPSSVQTIIKHVPPAKHNSDADDEGSVGASPHRHSSHRSSRSWGRRSKSFTRRRSKTIQEEPAEEPPVPPMPTTLERKRSKSLAGPGKALSKRPSNMDNLAHTGCMRGHGQPVTDPAHADFQSVARALETVPQKEGEGTSIASVPKAVRKASLRNKKSRELVRPVKSRSTTPAQSKLQSRSVEDLYPEWQSKPASEASSPAAQEAQIAAALPPANSRNFSSQIIPPLPELPTDLESMLCRADLMMSKKMKNSPKTSPRGSARNSMDAGRKHSSSNEGAQDQDLSKSLFAQTVVGEPPIAEEDIQMPVEADSKPLHRRQFSFEPLVKPAKAEPQAKSESPTHDAQHSGWPGWEQQSARWRQRISVIGDAAELPAAGEMSPEDNTTPTANSPTSPSIVVSRYITPNSSETAAHRSNSSHKRSSTVQVIGHISGDSDKENDSAAVSVRRSNSIVSTATYVTMSSTDGRTSSKLVDLSRNSAFSQTTTTTMTTTVSSRTSMYTSNNGSTSSLPAGRNRSASQQSLGNYMPYRPADSVHAERSRALNMARRSCQVNKADLEKLKLARQPSLSKPTSPGGFDRYGGGLEYGWDRQSGLTGSAGTRNSSSENLNRKSVKMSEDYGLDLSDVPVFLQRRA